MENKEFKLSDRAFWNDKSSAISQRKSRRYYEKDVKEFISRLKILLWESYYTDEMSETECELFSKEIDKLAGEELIKKFS